MFGFGQPVHRHCCGRAFTSGACGRCGTIFDDMIAWDFALHGDPAAAMLAMEGEVGAATVLDGVLNDDPAEVALGLLEEMEGM